jgi:hypothetical protein
MEVSGQIHAPVALIPAKNPRYLWIEGWVGPRASIDAVAKRKKIPAPTGNRIPVVQPVA